MNTTYPSASNQFPEPKKDNKSSVIILLSIALIGSWIYFFYARNEANSVIDEKNAQYATLDSARNTIQREYDSAIVRLEELTQTNTGLDSLVKTRNAELDVLKSKFRSLVGKQNATSEDLSQAKKLVSDLNSRIDDYVQEIQRLQAENQQLNMDKTNLSTENKNLNTTLSAANTARKQAEQKVDVGSTLRASGFSIVAIHERNSGKERSTSSAKRADKMRISFNLEQNRIATSGTKQLFIIAKDPAGKVIQEEGLASGMFDTRQDGQLEFTTKLDAEYNQNETKNISFDLKQSEKYMKGNYRIVVYQNGFNIGEGMAVLK